MKKQIRLINATTSCTKIKNAVYIIAGVVYQAPDLFTVLNSRLVSLFSLLSFGAHTRLQKI